MQCRLNSLCDANNELPIRLPSSLSALALLPSSIVPRVTAAISFSFPFDWTARGREEVLKWLSPPTPTSTRTPISPVVALVRAQRHQRRRATHNTSCSSLSLSLSLSLPFRFMINLFVMPNERTLERIRSLPGSPSFLPSPRLPPSLCTLRLARSGLKSGMG